MGPTYNIVCKVGLLHNNIIVLLDSTKTVLPLGSDPGVIRICSSVQFCRSIGRIVVCLILTHCHLSACDAIVGGVCCQWQLSLIAWWACLLCSVLPSLLVYVTSKYSECYDKGDKQGQDKPCQHCCGY